MTNELEKQFFDTFRIEPKQTCKVTSTCNNYVNYNDCNGCNSYKYPQISDRILLELICILGSIYICTQDRETLKEHILVQCIDTQMYSRDIKHQVRTLFEEG